MERLAVIILIGGGLLPVSFSTSTSAGQELSNGVAPQPAAVVVIAPQSAREMESTTGDIVLKPPTFAERNSLGGLNPTFSADRAKPAIADPAAVVKEAADMQQIDRNVVRSRISHAQKVTGNGRQAPSSSWKNKIWGLPD